ncbi:MAG: hypothetical protein R2771_05570 [Saprospiraceae bacterium]
MENIIMTGTGSYVPPVLVKNDEFLDKEFYDENGEKCIKIQMRISLRNLRI